MMISLPPELEAFAHRQVENGKYGSIEALLAAGVRALIDREDILNSQPDRPSVDVYQFPNLIAELPKPVLDLA